MKQVITLQWCKANWWIESDGTRNAICPNKKCKPLKDICLAKEYKMIIEKT
jgi:hypothetical protein